MEPTNEVIGGRSDTVDLEAVNRSLSTAVSELMAELSKADAEVERLRAALRPFAEAANGFDMQNVKNPEEWFAYGGIREGGQSPVGAITVGDLRRARTALQDKRDE
jgi:hypothetical protein